MGDHEYDHHDVVMRQSVDGYDRPWYQQPSAVGMHPDPFSSAYGPGARVQQPTAIGPHPELFSSVSGPGYFFASNSPSYHQDRQQLGQQHAYTFRQQRSELFDPREEHTFQSVQPSFGIPQVTRK